MTVFNPYRSIRSYRNLYEYARYTNRWKDLSYSNLILNKT